MNEKLCLQNGILSNTFKVKDPISALTHFIAFCAALTGMPALLIKAAYFGQSTAYLISFAVFMISMVLLYGASTAYHSFHISDEGDRVLKRLDHMMIFVLIAGSYTPVCTIVLNGATGRNLLLLVWGSALAGIAFKAFWVCCPKWVSSVIYITMGWSAALAFVPLYRGLSGSAFAWLLAGGVIYTVGGVIYACRLPALEKPGRAFKGHELFHVFVMAGSLCHYLLAFVYLVKM